MVSLSKSVRATLLRLDFLSTPVPRFNIRGETSVKTYCGGLVSIMITIVTTYFALHRLNILMNKKNPMISTFTDQSIITHADTFSVSEMAKHGFQMAFGLRNYQKGVLDDERYISWVAREYTQHANGTASS